MISIHRSLAMEDSLLLNTGLLQIQAVGDTALLISLTQQKNPL